MTGGIRGLADGAIEALVVPSFTKVGFDVRRRLFGWEDLGTVRLDGRVVLITGATSGLGLSAGLRLARMGATLLLVGRNAAKTDAAVEQVSAVADGGAVRGYLADMSVQADVRRLASEVRASEPRLDVLIHNAGALLASRQESVDGHEMSVATMVFGPFLLTAELMPLLERTAAGEPDARPTRVVFVTSGGMYTQRLDVATLEMPADGYRGSVAYARAKRAQVVLTEMLGERLERRGVVVHAMHPGWSDTPGVEASLPTFRKALGPLLRSPEQGADTIVWLAASDEPARSTGYLWLDRSQRSAYKLPWTKEPAAERARLWERCVEATGADPTATATLPADALDR